MRSDRIATCTSGDPVSPDLVPYSLISSALRLVVTDIGLSLIWGLGGGAGPNGHSLSAFRPCRDVVQHGRLNNAGVEPSRVGAAS